MANPYLWVAVLGGIMAFGYGFLIGANDVANAFASSVSSKSLTLRQAILAAAIFEFLGAVGLGAAVTSTVRSKIVDIDLYEGEPYTLMFGMFTALSSAVLVLGIATHLALPVSTTHDIVGCIMGFSIGAKGFGSVNWGTAKLLFISWIASPLISGTVGLVFFSFVKHVIMRSQHSFQRAYLLFPVVLLIGIGIDLFYVLNKGLNNVPAMEDFPGWKSFLIAFGCGLFCGMLWIQPIGPWAKKRIEILKKEEEDAAAEKNNEDLEESNDKNEEVEQDPKSQAASEEEEGTSGKAKDGAEKSTFKGLMTKLADNTVNQDLHAQSMKENKRSQHIWENADMYDSNSERLFNFIQVFTACLNSFAHGANDVANTIAPFSAVIFIYQHGSFESKVAVPKWILAYGGFSIVVGLALYGYRVMKSIGYKLTALSPSRGACAELAASLTVVTASFLGIPVSSTQCIVGAVSGVGLVNGPKNVNWLFLLRVMVGWVVNFFMAALISALVFSFAYYSPGKCEYS